MGGGWLGLAFAMLRLAGLSVLAVFASYLGKRGGCAKPFAAEHLSHAVWSHTGSSLTIGPRQ
jgi:hypothetical protein